MPNPQKVDQQQLLTSQVAALEQLLDVHEQTVLEQSERLQRAQSDLAKRVAELAESNAELLRVNARLNREMQERRQAQASLRRSERLAAIGTLAAGVAHEINNPLGLIALEVHHAARHAGNPQALMASLDRIGGHVKRCARIVKSVLQFAREETTEKWPVSLNEIAENARDMTRERARVASITLELVLAPNAPELTLNPTEMEQVFVNLIHNAIEASAPGARVRLMTTFDERAVRAIVTDDGCGMTDGDLQRAFDPFYTTRSRRGGTGLGLSTCHGIITALGGTIEILSEDGRGTTVTVTLPLAKQVERKT
jgi:two-component system, NtrC family, sensor kinase